MADSDTETNSQPDTFSLRHLSSSFFNIPGFFVGCGYRGSLDFDSVRSPRSPLDFSFFTNLCNPFSNRSPRLPCQSDQKKWDCNKVGLGIVHLLVDETKPTSEVLDSDKRKTIIFAPTSKSNGAFGSEGVLLETKPFESSSVIGLATSNPNLSSQKSSSENRTTSTRSFPVEICGCSQTNKSLAIKPNSLPITVGSGQGYVGSLSAREIELSEDYTCIISHGPNPKTTHVFGDYILECHSNELSNFDKENLGIKLPQEAKRPKHQTPYPLEEFLSICYSCKKNLEKADDIYMYRGEKVFCSFDCHSEEIFAEQETKKTCNKPIQKLSRVKLP
ncbi:hypothetical protein OIU84_022921 [Salix udensis]|uniref:FLZ-type domain-containing protein n=1 Tax=Salix udensis TaxID=889485 RepID=A0AAD6KQ15_9ROSI|nr:hypothetical protein OIU84_022921 [Salix udensis]